MHKSHGNINTNSVTFFFTEVEPGKYAVWYQVNNSQPICWHHKTVSREVAIANINDAERWVIGALIHYQDTMGWFQKPDDPQLPCL